MKRLIILGILSAVLVASIATAAVANHTYDQELSTQYCSGDDRVYTHSDTSWNATHWDRNTGYGYFFGWGSVYSDHFVYKVKNVYWNTYFLVNGIKTNGYMDHGNTYDSCYLVV